MTKNERGGRIFLLHPHTNNGFFNCFLLTIKYRILCLKMLPGLLEYAEMQHVMMMSIYKITKSLDNQVQPMNSPLVTAWVIR